MRDIYKYAKMCMPLYFYDIKNEIYSNYVKKSGL